MVLENISLLNFKNITQCELEFSPNINCLVGDNGTGKTNLLDAIYFMSITKSALNLTDGQCICHGTDFFMINGHYLIGERHESVVCSFKRGAGKSLKRNGKPYDRMAEHIGLLPIVMVAPGDTALIQESGDERRRFLNSFLSQIDRNYFQALMRYNQLLAERNKVLKSPTGYDDILEILDMQLSEVGGVIFARRTALIEELAPIVARYYAILSGDSEKVELRYRSDLQNYNFSDLLRNSATRDRAMGHSTVGVHRDDLLMTIMDYPIRKYGSQGQQKSMLIALKLAQAEIIKHQNQTSAIRPILLLDDVFDKLDFQRVENLLKLVSSEDFGQIFITDSNKTRMESTLTQLSGDYRLFRVSMGGVIIQETASTPDTASE